MNKALQLSVHFFSAIASIVALSIAAPDISPDESPITAPDTTVSISDTLQQSVQPDVKESLPVVKSDTVPLTHPVEQDTGIVIDGIIIVKATGTAPLPDDSVSVIVDSTTVPLSADGEFTSACSQARLYHVAVRSPRFTDILTSVPHLPGKTNYFITIVLEQRDTTKHTATIDNTVSPETSSVAWTISGTVVDSRFELPVRYAAPVLFFDDTRVPVSSNGNFSTTTFIGGTHTFHLSIPGYHTVSQPIVLTNDDKQPYITIATTILSEAITRREITVSADALPLHRTAEPSKIEITRKELVRSTATMNDPLRALQTLPGVTAESDVSARPIVRGGDEMESRVFLDGIPLLQPYHFGGVRSTVNQSALRSLTFYKSGFPAELHNAQSAIVEAHSRVPTDDKKLSIEADINYLQYCVYAGLPLFGGNAGINVSSQGSYFDAISKAAFGLIGASGNQNAKALAGLLTLPDYRDFSAGFSFTPDSRFKLFINEVYNTDRTRFCTADTVVDVAYNYYRPDSGEVFPIDTQMTAVLPYIKGNSYNYDYFYYKDRQHDGDPIIGKPYPNPDFNDTTSSDNRRPYYPEYDSLVDVTYTYRTVPSDRQPDSTVRQTISKSSVNSYYKPFQEYGTYSDDPVFGKPYYQIDTLMEYRSHYNILYSTAQYLPTDDQIVNATIAWQSRGWDLDFPTVTGDFDSSIYDVHLNQFNVNAGWQWTGLDKHTVKAGGQLDFTSARYNVFLVRFLHQMIVNGSTNMTDFWGPINGDTAMVLFDPLSGFGQGQDLYSLTSRLFVAYEGNRSYYNAAAYCQDAWDITPRLHADLGVRAEYGKTDHETWVSPRVNLRYTLREGTELTATGGLYTQNNYDISAIALSEDLKPEKVWHGGTGITTRLLPWLEQSVEVYGKYYYDLLSEVLTPTENMPSIEEIEQIPDSLVDPMFTSSDDFQQYLLTQFMLFSAHRTSYVNDGRGKAWGIDYQLRFTPSDFWHGWISLSWGKSYRQRRPGWRIHPFPLERPLLIAVSNYYRLPQQFEIGIRYRYCSGIPYTSTALGDFGTINNSYYEEDTYPTTMRVGNYNDSRYTAYQRLDIRFSKGFSFKGGKGHFYIEIWNSMNTPNIMGVDSKTKSIKTFLTNLPVTIPFFGVDYTF